MSENVNCFKCSKPITSGSVVSALDKKWHPQCFVCAGCQAMLASQPFHVKEDIAYCAKCWTLKFQPKCSKCNTIIPAEEQFITYNEKAYHQKCFLCVKCKASLAGKQFCLKDGGFHCPGCV